MTWQKPGQRAAQGAPADEQSGETSHVAVSDAMVEAALRSADDVSARLVAGKRPTISDVEDLRNHVRKLAAALTAALGAEPGEAVAVKPLVWEEIHQRRSDEDPSTEVIGFEASNGFGEWYWIEVRAADFVLHYPDADGSTKLFETERDTKAAAQADYEKRVLSALVHPLPLKEEVERVLEPFALVAEVDIGESETDEDLFRPVNDERHARAPRLTVGDLRAARALLSRIRAGAQEGWRSIETAPKDGSTFLAFGSYVYEGDTAPTIYIRVAEYSGEPNWPWRDAEGLHRETFYSHWMPLPAAPSPEAKGGRS